MSSRLTPPPPLIAALALAALAACTKAADRAGPQHDASVNDSASAAPATPAPGPTLVTVVATEYRFEAPDTIPAELTTFRLVDQGRELHHMTLIRLDSGKTITDFVQAVKHPGPLAPWMIEEGGVNPPRPGGGVAEVTETLQPGQYVIACFVPSPDGTPHIVKGMMRALTVAPTSTPAATEPTADVTMTLTDYAFQLSTPLTPGKHIIRVDNAGQQTHEVVLAKLAPGKTVADLAAWVDKMVGPPPGEPIGGIAGMHASAHGYVTVDLTPGTYALLCFIPDAKDGKPHVAHGMMKQLTIS